MFARLSLPAFLVVSLSVTVPALAQDAPGVVTPTSMDQVQPAFSHLFSDIAHDLTRLPTVGNAITIGAGGALALAVRPADRNLTRRASLSEDMGEAFGPGSGLGSGYAQFGGAIATWMIGKATDSPRVQALGYDLVRAQVVNEILTQGLKFGVGRTRPDGTSHSFPSGHTSSSFATATVLQRYFGWKVGVPAYALASYVGASRMQANRHYASDVIFGAALGIVSGRTVTLGHGKTKFALSPMAVAGGAGVSFVRIGAP